jgi:hypothetical protein
MTNRFFGIVVVLFISCVATAFAQVVIAPGFEYTLTQDNATGGTAGNNGNPSFALESTYGEVSRTVKAQVSGGISIGVGEAHSTIYYDFDVPATPATNGNTVGAWVSYSTSWRGYQLILATLGSNASVLVDLTLRDLTETRNLRTEAIHDLDLKSYEYEFITAGFNLNDSDSKSDTFAAVLKRGHSYRLILRLSATVMITSPGGIPSVCDYMDGLAGGGSGRVELNSLFVKVGIDEKELMQKVEGIQNHRHVYMTGRGEGHNNTEALSSTPINEKSTVMTSAPIIIFDTQPARVHERPLKP